MTKAHFETDRHMTDQLYYCVQMHVRDANNKPINKIRGFMCLCVYIRINTKKIQKLIRLQCVRKLPWTGTVNKETRVHNKDKTNVV